MKEVFITHHQIVSPLGFDSQSNFDNLKLGKSCIGEQTDDNGNTFFGGLLKTGELDKHFSEIGNINEYTKLEKMLILVINNLLKSSGFKPNEHTGIIISTTKGNIDVCSPNSPFHEDQKRAFLPELGKQVQQFFGLKNECITLSNACVSGVLALSVGARLIQQSMYKEVIVLSGDLISDFILSGFNSFQATSSSVCQPYSKERNGINIGEAAAGVLMTGNKANINKESVQILGSATSNDANHISGPSRTGEGLVIAVTKAIEEAKISSSDIDYISAHGTATVFNDEMESIAFGRLNLTGVPLNSLKGYYGHTFGSSGLLETIIGIESINNDTLVACHGYKENGVTNPLNIIKKTTKKPLKTFLKTASGFGGCNTAILIKKIDY